MRAAGQSNGKDGRSWPLCGSMAHKFLGMGMNLWKRTSYNEPYANGKSALMTGRFIYGKKSMNRPTLECWEVPMSWAFVLKNFMEGKGL
ncbi:hypothetical protein M493_17090 [Geobacillus genomosp. 3]|uniref:Uncharacterized protein n=1 Tax=Geobacillus genomosp. 3 TaxID=1921421 RepID=S5Z9V2_GEOG3|nr:hypothetical protein M493_17090 [Geobacillus genomosp. 3]